jgi:anti-anti-sigma factor
MNHELSEVDGVVVFKPLVRMVDQVNAQTWLSPLRDTVAAGRRIVLDLSAIQFLNSAALGAIVTMIKDVRLKGGELRLAAPQPTVRTLFKMVKLENIARIDEQVDVAIAALSKPHE